MTKYENGAISYDLEVKIDAKTWNPFTGCAKISPGYKHCYAETKAHKLQKWGTSGYQNGFDITVQHERLEKAVPFTVPLKRKKPTFWFINAMSDTFYEDADDASIDRIMNVVKRGDWHNFYILTKCSDRMRDYFDKRPAPDNLWIGVTVDDREYGLPRLRNLKNTNGRNKHICCEPLLEDLGQIDLTSIRLVIGGGESGPKATRCMSEWVTSLCDECLSQNVHFYCKQWGTYGPDGSRQVRSRTGHFIEGKPCLSIPGDLML